jgi:hypothetical protein
VSGQELLAFLSKGQTALTLILSKDCLKQNDFYMMIFIYYVFYIILLNFFILDSLLSIVIY